MRIFVLPDRDIERSVVDPRPTIEAEARADQGLEKALYWRHIGGAWELHSVNFVQGPGRVSA